MLLAIETKMKKRKGVLSVEFVFIVAAIVILAAILIPKYMDFQESTRRAVAAQELKTLAESCVFYAALSKDGQPPANLGALVTGLTAAQSNDGQAYGSFIVKKGYTSTASSFVDPWGNAYTYDATNRTISSTANGGTAISQNF